LFCTPTLLGSFLIHRLYLLHSSLVAEWVVLRQDSCHPSPVHTPRHLYCCAIISYPDKGENKIIAIPKYLSNWIGSQDYRNSGYNRLTVVCSVENKGKADGASRGVATFLFLCAVTVVSNLCWLILVNTNLIKVHSFFGSITSNAVYICDEH
jgi:hypothetical protein